MPVLFSNDKPKVNFQLVTFKYSEMSELDGSTKTRVSKRMDLKIPFNSPEIQAQTNVLYYVNLGTSHLPDADFSLAFWYTDEAITHVESAILAMKKKNSNTLLKVLNIVRGRMSEISQKKYYPDKELGISHQPTVITPEILRNLEAERKAEAFMLRSYVVTVDLSFNSDWKDLEKSRKTSLLQVLDGYADKQFPEIVSTILLETPMATCPYSLVIYADHYTDVQNFMSSLTSLPIYNFIQDFTKVLICNHTACATLESPKEMVRRS